MGSMLKNRYTYTMLLYMRHAARYGIASAAGRALCKCAEPKSRLAPVSKQDIFLRLDGCGGVSAEPEELFFTSLNGGCVPRSGMREFVRELRQRGIKIYVPKKYISLKPVLDKLSFGDIAFEDTALPVISCRDGANIRIPSPMEMFEKSTAYSVLKRFLKSNKELFELIIKKGVYSSPFCLDKRGEAVIDEPYILGYAVFAPLMYSFTDFLSEEAKKYDKLFFLSREGYLLKQLYDMRFSGDTEYLLASRRAVSFACIESGADADDILSTYYRGSVKNLLYSRFGIECDIGGHISLPEEKARAAELIEPYCGKMIKSASREREEYLKYLASVGLSEGSAVADVGYRGSIQHYLSRLTGKRLDGLYITSLYDALPGKSCKSLYPVYNAFELPRHPVYPHHLYLEAALKAPHGQLLCFDGGSPVFSPGGESDSFTEEIQSGIKAFFEDFKGNMDSEAAAEIFNAFISLKMTDGSVSDRLFVEDSYCSDGDTRPH